MGARAGEYEVRSLLGRGGMGIVYAGVHPLIGKEVAIKVLDPRLATSEEIVGRFVREAQAVNKIQHPNIIDIFAFGKSPELGHYFVMPRLRGLSLAERIDQGPLAAAEALPILEQIAAALDAAHAANITHRDLKPDNVYLVTDRRDAVGVQLLDFGVAKLLDQDPTSATHTGAQIGTPLFMAPEQWDSSGIDHRTDVYALGIIVHNMFTGRYPHEAASPVALMNKHCLQAPALPSAHGGPAALDPIVARALSKDKLARPQSAGEVYAAVAAALAPTATAAPASPSAPALATNPVPATSPLTTLGASSGSRDELDVPPRRSFAPLIAALAGLAVAIVAVVAVVRGGSREDAGAVPAAAPDAPSYTLAADAATLTSPLADAAAPPRPVDARVAPRAIDARAAPRPVDARPVPRAVDAAPIPVDARTVRRPDDARTEPRARPDAGVRAPRDARPRPRPPADSAWGSTVNPFGTPP